MSLEECVLSLSCRALDNFVFGSYFQPTTDCLLYLERPSLTSGQRLDSFSLSLPRSLLLYRSLLFVFKIFKTILIAASFTVTLLAKKLVKVCPPLRSRTEMKSNAACVIRIFLANLKRTTKQMTTTKPSMYVHWRKLYYVFTQSKARQSFFFRHLFNLAGARTRRFGRARLKVHQCPATLLP